MINLCVPVLHRYDLLVRLIKSVLDSDLLPDQLWIIDNGGYGKTPIGFIAPSIKVQIHTPSANLGVAASWNWFLKHVPEERIIVNDDVVFASKSLRAMVETPGVFVSALLPTNAFSCFLIRDDCVRRTGFFDENISPGYAYFEDVDYEWRMKEQNIEITPVECEVQHQGSASLVPNPDHHRRFIIAQTNFERKWGRLPGPKQRYDE